MCKIHWPWLISFHFNRRIHQSSTRWASQVRSRPPCFSWSTWIVLQVRQGDALQWERLEWEEFANCRISMSLSVALSWSTFEFSPENYKIWTWFLMFFDAQLSNERKACTELLAKSYSFALLASWREQPHVTCILAAALQHHSFIFENATKTPWFASRPDFWCALRRRPKIQVGPGNFNSEKKLIEMYWVHLSTEIASAFELCVVRKISAHHSHFNQRVSTLDWAENGKGMSHVLFPEKCWIGSSVWLLPSPI